MQVGTSCQLRTESVREAGEDGWGEFVEALGGAIDFAPQRQQER
jgi:hypothetical protein